MLRLRAFCLGILLVSCSSSSNAPADGSPAADAPPTTPDAQIVGDSVTASPDLGGGDGASEACLKYCECMAKNCADKMFPGGCLPDCASHPAWDIPCRQNMCNLVPAQPNNDHCTHAFGVFQCLDKK
jgi:hypothetical protein